MGSLMAGWNSPIKDPKSSTYKRNWSFTKGEIDSYWKSKKKIEKEHLGVTSSLSDCSKEDADEESGSRYKRSSSFPLTNTKEGFGDMDAETNLEELKKHVWWTRSNWAFLNEPPVFEGHSKTKR
ncbi:hypothetical protein CFOL_v3_20603 [Cephalotus follicularis]|uniref:Uncharacterized protein n=1 Tax=Cephalotus follicularis TaxID=3775 RepID=A0A1Q3CAM5_CEPFO|nr:hypothetical protein CFOL_v3_20603 [Cephalotus follicularis]